MTAKSFPRRYTSPVADVTKAQLEKAGIATVEAELYVITVADSHNPVLIPEGDEKAAQFFRSRGEPIAFVPWNEEKKCWIDPVSGRELQPVAA